MHGQPVSAGAYAPELISIKAREIQSWAQDSIGARRKLPVLLRKLIHSTGRDLTHVDFPAYDNAERRGWDGEIETAVPTPWIPNGKSGWECSCNDDSKRKANRDYVARIRSVPSAERKELTFVFVTPDNWSAKKAWAKEKAAQADWKDVRAYDASDLEQWLEESATTQIWFAEQFGRPVGGYRSIDECWSKWADNCNPALSPALFDPAVERFAEAFEGWLSNPPHRPFIVAADSGAEALAFLACLARHNNLGSGRVGDTMIVFDTPKALRRFDVPPPVPLVAIIHDPAVEKEIGGFYRRCHCIITQPRNTVNVKPDIALDPLGYSDFEKALVGMGFAHHRIERLARESARSPTILRRRLSEIPAIQTPDWAGDAEIARKLLPAAMVGAWHKASLADREVVQFLALSDNDGIVANNVTEMLALEDPPLWSAGEYRGVVSRIDALVGIARFITENDLENFFLIAEYVLSERDPTIDLPEDKRWTAPLHGKVRNHSDILRRGIRETLNILAVHGNELFRGLLGFDAEARVASLVRKLLSPLDREKILSQNKDLPDYAEAAPEEVLSIVESDLQTSEPVVLELMRPTRERFFNTPRRTELLWALESLAWNPQRFPRVVELLAKLCTSNKNEAHDNWTNKPENTLGSLFRSWLPQTTASLDERVKALEGLCHRHPMLGWSVCIAQLESRDVAIPNHCPRWRGDAANANRKVTRAEQLRFIRKALDLVLNWPQPDEDTLGELVQRLEHFSAEDQLQVWNRIDQWVDATPSEDAKAILRQRIHACAHMRHRRSDSIAHPERERTASEKLLPSDILIRHAWLFKSHWVKLPPDAEDEEFDHDKNAQRLHELRLKALREIWEKRGFEGMSALLERIGEMSSLVGNLMTEILEGRHEAVGFIKSCLRTATRDNIYEFCLAGFLGKVNTGLIVELIDEIERSCEPDAFLTLLLCMPFRATTWRCLNNKPTNIRDGYWKSVKPQTWGDVPEEEINESIERLLAVDRGPAAFRAACLAWDQVETSRLTRLLHALPAADLKDFLKDSMVDHYTSKAFDELDKRSGVTVEEKAKLEYAHFILLDRSEHGIPNLEKQISISPGLYAQLIACVFKRADGEEDPPELRFGDPEQRAAITRVAYRLLDRISRIPGTNGNGNIDAGELKAWLGEVRLLCARYARTEIGNHMLGQFLARAPAGEDGVWPCRPVCKALEWMASEEVGRGFRIGSLNRRGVHRRAFDEGGDQERELADRYRYRARKLVYQYPYVGGLLERIAAAYEHQAGWEDTESDIRQRLSFR